MRQVAVYKTNVKDRSKTKTIVDIIRRSFPGCDVSLDLGDCDKVLRVEYAAPRIEETEIRNILRHHGHQMEALP